MSVKIIQSRDHILNTYSEKISQFAEVSLELRSNDWSIDSDARGVRS